MRTMHALFALPSDALKMTTIAGVGRARILQVVALAGVVIATGLAYQEHQAMAHLRSQLIVLELQPMAALLTENQSLIEELQAEPFTEKNSGILESFLAKIRRDGVSNHADMKQRLDIIADNNTAIVTLIKAYAPRSSTPAFTIEGEKFRDYATAWRDRWNSVMEIFMAGGNYATAAVPLPAGFSTALKAEIEVSR